jgi:hypothetical protein
MVTCSQWSLSDEILGTESISEEKYWRGSWATLKYVAIPDFWEKKSLL